MCKVHVPFLFLPCYICLPPSPQGPLSLSADISRQAASPHGASRCLPVGPPALLACVPASPCSTVWAVCPQPPWPYAPLCGSAMLSRYASTMVSHIGILISGRHMRDNWQGGGTDWAYWDIMVIPCSTVFLIKNIPTFPPDKFYRKCQKIHEIKS